MLFALPVTQYHELDRLGRDIAHLNRLYVVFDSFAAFNESLRGRLWSQTNLAEVAIQLEEMLTKTNALPASLHVWAAFTEMKETLQNYTEV